MNTVDGFPTIIDGIVDHIVRLGYIKVAQWYVPEWDSSVVSLILFDGRFDDKDLERIRQVSDKIIYLRWDVSSTYIFRHAEGKKHPIYRDFDCNDPKNKHWLLSRSIQVHLYFKVLEVGTPKLWKPNMRKVHVESCQSG